MKKRVRRIFRCDFKDHTDIAKSGQAVGLYDLNCLVWSWKQNVIETALNEAIEWPR